MKITDTDSGPDNLPEKPALAMSENTPMDIELTLDSRDGGNTDQAARNDPYDIASSLLKIFRVREKYRPVELDGLGETGWNILLELFICSKKGHRASVSDVMLATGYTDKAALRYIRVLEGRGLIRCSYRQKDAQIVYLALSDEGHLIMSKILPMIANEASSKTLPPDSNA